MRARRDDYDASPPVTIDNVVAVRATKLALLVEFEDGRQLWVPQSQITEDSEVYADGHSGKLVVTGWWAEKERLGVRE